MIYNPNYYYYYNNPDMAIITQPFMQMSQGLARPIGINCYDRQYLQPIYYLRLLNSLSVSFSNLFHSSSKSGCNFQFTDNFYSSTNPNRISFNYLQIISRACAAAYPYYRPYDSKCYTTCPDRTYTQSFNSSCFECRYDCFSCSVDLTSCTACNAA